ncbi:hypothetical protein [Idiomarina ramblicola]|uniref:Uncharacterized protein n=1 Tax=Idiomarina ramblicola TaxID=263724 RepID=A0A432Z5W6_9GAMM|nr:hypothetical protein [Idiomarina ramblicola]RUO73276.1 hypothetical protein CWI78_02180 [Idiomarina ramblicola]
MYFVNINSLKEQHTSGQYQEKDSLVYAIASVVLTYLGVLLVTYPESIWLNVQMAVEAALFLVMFVTAYRSNGGNEGSRFLDKFLSIGWVVGIRLIPLAIILGVVSLYGDATYYGKETDHVGPYSLVTMLIFYLFFIWRLSKHIRDIRN